MVPWGGLTCCLGAAALYLLGISCGSYLGTSQVLMSVAISSLSLILALQQVTDLIGDDLISFHHLNLLCRVLVIPCFFHLSAQLLDIESKVIPLIVTISGRVGSETPINCEHSGLRGVIVEEAAVQHFLKRNDAGSWIEDSALMPSMSKEVPWYLVRTYFSSSFWFELYAGIVYVFWVSKDDGMGRAYVVGARSASGFALTFGSEVFDDSGRSIGRGTLDYRQGLMMLGVERIERVLPIGSSLTVVGEVQFFRLYKYASFGLAIFGAFLITKHAILYFWERRRRRELQRRVLAAAAKRSGPDNEDPTLKVENGAEPKRDCMMPNTCVICLEQEYNAVFIQ
ncbi:mitochondrial ubiquitin ligase activator of NFKB 1-like [Gossypium australe]|uniref:RING-type E3 ubiquitin transferase n=1 Tax=Gossypium australe TaxID=47621 RepID=A0A5B6X7D0_9ROSI|nr:mitochondrial ubiquitin ligase activator of NFKB 1-like [Gossypium australe]